VAWPSCVFVSVYVESRKEAGQGKERTDGMKKEGGGSLSCAWGERREREGALNVMVMAEV